MKKVLSLVIMFIFALSGYSVLADGELTYETVEPVAYPETYIERSMRLFSVRKTLEQTLAEGWENLETEIVISDYGIKEDNLANVYRGILYKNPLLYYVDTGFMYSRYSDGTVYAVYPNYRETDKEVVADTIEEINLATEEILMYLDEDMTDFEKIMTVHDYMVLHYEYDFSNTCYDIRIMTSKKGLCQGYSLAFKHIMDKLGIECSYVVGAEEMNHGWNLVKLDNEWYHIDLTWDDAGDNFGIVNHKFALLSDYEIQHLEKQHYGYNLNGVEASSDKYDKKHWHEGNGSIVTISNIYYYVDENNVVDQNGKVIFKDLDTDNKWSIGGNYYIPSQNYTGLAEHNGILYFNTEKEIYSYNPKNGKVEKILQYDGICGLLIDRNTLMYCKFDRTTNKFEIAGEYHLGKIRFGGTFHENGKIIKRIFKDTDAENVNIYADCDDCVKVEKITKSGVSRVTFDEKECQTLFYWTDDLKPLKEKEVYNQ